MKTTTFTVILFFSLLVASFSSNAQCVTLGVRGGISIPNLTSGGSNENPLNTGYSSSLGPEAGIFADFKISNMFSLQPMVEYSAQGGKKDGFQALTLPSGEAALFPPGYAPSYLYATYDSKAEFGYLMVPVLAKFGWNLGSSSPWRIYVDAGPFVSFLLSAKQVTSGESTIYADAGGTMALPGGPQSFNNTEDIKSQLNKINAGGEANIGLKYHFDKSNVFVEGGGNYGAINIQKGTANGKNNTGAATVAVGYSYGFGQ